MISEEEFTEFYETYFKYAHGVAKNKLFGTFQDTDDLVQRAFIRAWTWMRKPETIVTNPRGLIAMCVKLEYGQICLSYSHDRRVANNTAYSIEAYFENQRNKNNKIGEMFLNLDVADNCQQVAELKEALSYVEKLPAHYRQPILAQAAGYDLNEIQDRLGWTIDQVKHNLSRGKKMVSELSETGKSKYRKVTINV